MKPSRGEYLNIDRKMAFAASMPSGRKKDKLMERFLYEASVIESAIHKDLCEMDEEEAGKGLQLFGASYFSIRNILMDIRKYVKWCMEQGFAGKDANGFMEISAQQVDPEAFLRSCLFLKAEELVEAIEKAFDYPSINYAIPAMCFIWLGFSLQEICELTKADVDLENHLVLGKRIPDIFIPILSVYASTDVGYLKNKDGYRPIEKRKTEYFISPVSNSAELMIKPYQISKALKILTKYYNDATGLEKEITFDSIRKSGRFDEMYVVHKSATRDELIQLYGIKDHTAKWTYAKNIDQEFRIYCKLREEKYAT